MNEPKMPAIEPVWKRATKVDDLREYDKTLAQLELDWTARGRDAESSAMLFDFIIGGGVGDELRLVASQITRVAARISDVRLEVRIRIRDLEAGAQS